MKTKNIILGLISLVVLVGCKPTTSSELPSASEDVSDTTSVDASSVAFVEPEPVWSPTGHWNFTPLTIDESDTWVSIPKPGLIDAATYWDDVNWTLRGTALRDNLYTIMRKSFKGITYGQAQTALKTMDADPTNPDNVLSLYDLKSHPYSGYYSSAWNREHVYPQSKLSARADDQVKYPQPNVATDVANLFVCDADLNSQRSNNSMGEWNYSSDPETFFPFTTRNTAGELTDSILRRGLFSPTELVRGEVARSQLYMLVLWRDDTGAANSNFAIETMLKWDIEHAPTLERDGQRQQGLEEWQKIRNPFIDNRKVGCYIWGDLNNHTRKVCNEAGIDF